MCTGDTEEWSADNVTDVQQPVFVTEPDEHYYIIKGKAIVITCKAINALQLTFTCGGHVVRPRHQVNEEVEEPGEEEGLPWTRSLQSSISIEKEDVEQHEGVDGYTCQCHAWSSVPDKSAVSRSGLVQVACKCFLLLIQCVVIT